jgi:RNA recognition motif-containing protein
MENDDNAQQAIDSLNGNDFMGRNLVVNEARRK